MMKYLGPEKNSTILLTTNVFSKIFSFGKSNFDLDRDLNLSSLVVEENAIPRGWSEVIVEP